MLARGETSANARSPTRTPTPPPSLAILLILNLFIRRHKRVDSSFTWTAMFSFSLLYQVEKEIKGVLHGNISN